ncbi:MAG: O-methyltransferase [Terracidiphilus sp.]|jgi:predicted O-methyltransferase YrrM
MQNLWTEVDRYFCDLLAPADEKLEAALAANRQAGLPTIDVSPLQGKFLDILVRISGARRILEIGTLGGYSTICMARALPEGGRIVTLEVNPRHADVARANLLNAGVLDRVDIHVGRAIDTLPILASSGAGPFDLIFIDADKPSNSDYLAWALKLSRPGTLIVTDNVVRDGRVVQAESADADVQCVRRFTEMMAAEPRLSATVLQTVGVKGYDGFALAVVLR